MMNLGLILIEFLLSEYDEDIVQPLLKDNGGLPIILYNIKVI
jgi:hypothetical protein